MSPSRWRRTAVGVRPKLALSAPALCGPLSCNARATRSRVRASSGPAAATAAMGASDTVGDFTTAMLPIYSRPCTPPLRRDGYRGLGSARFGGAVWIATRGPTIDRDDSVHDSDRPLAGSRSCLDPATHASDRAPARSHGSDRQHRHRVDRRLGPPDQLGPRLPLVARLLQRRPGPRPRAVRSQGHRVRQSNADRGAGDRSCGRIPRRMADDTTPGCFGPLGLGHVARRTRADRGRRRVDLHPPEPARGRGALHVVHAADRGRHRALVAHPRTGGQCSGAVARSSSAASVGLPGC